MKASRSVQVQGAKPRGARLVAAGVVGALVAAGLGAVVAAPAQAAGVAPLPVGPRPNATRVEFRAAERVSASVDVGTGNLLVTTTDLTLPGVDQDVQLGLDFNSLLLGAGSALPAGAAGRDSRPGSGRTPSWSPTPTAPCCTWPLAASRACTPRSAAPAATPPRLGSRTP